jgi:hypothetical protein
MKRPVCVLSLGALLAACAANAPPQAEHPATRQQAVQTVVRDYDAESITGSHLRRRGSTMPAEAQTLSPAALEDWQRQRPNPKGPGGF